MRQLLKRALAAQAARRGGTGLGELPADLRRALREAPGLPGGVAAPPPEFIPARANVGIQNKRTAAGASVQVAPARGNRSYLAIQNQSAVNEIWYQFGGDAGNGVGFVIPPGGSDIWEVVVPVGGVYVWSAAAGQGVGIAEGVPVAGDLEGGVMPSDAGYAGGGEVAEAGGGDTSTRAERIRAFQTGGAALDPRDVQWMRMRPGAK